jgi:hypothetical protein
MDQVQARLGIAPILQKGMHGQAQLAVFTGGQPHTGLQSPSSVVAIAPALGALHVKEKINGQSVLT